MRTFTMRRFGLLAAVLAALGIAGGGVAWAAASRPSATCTPSPATTTGTDGVSFAVRCTVPTPPPATTTVTSTVTSTVTVTSAPTTSAPSTTSTTTAPTTSAPTTTAPATPPSTGFPTANTTGPRVGTSPGSGNVCGTVSGRLITGDLVLGCDSTVTDSRVMGRVVSNGYRLTGSYLEIGPDSCPAKSTTDFQAIRGPVTLDHSHIHNNPGQDPVALIGTTTIRDSLIDRTCFYAGDHLDGAQLYDPGAKTIAVLDHNTIDPRPVNAPGERGNSAIFLADTPGRGTSITVTDSLLMGGNYTVSAYDAYAGSGVVYDIRDNVFAKGATTGPTYGACSSNSAPYDGTSGLRFTGNAYDDGTALGSC